MRQGRRTEEQIINILKESEGGIQTGELCRKYGISSATFCKWKDKYGGIDVNDALDFAVPEAGVKEFTDLFQHKYGIKLEAVEAQQRFSELLLLFTLLLRED